MMIPLVLFRACRLRAHVSRPSELTLSTMCVPRCHLLRAHSLLQGKCSRSDAYFCTQSTGSRFTDERFCLEGTFTSPARAPWSSDIVRNAGRVCPCRGNDVGGVLALLLHGDASLAGLGVAAEAIQLGGLPSYSIGGAIHVVVNNAVGFTTLPAEGRASQHATDVAKAAGVPIVHANADDPEALAYAFELAADWRARWHADVFVDVCGYRRNGHNELDDPSTTLPMTSRAIESHPGVVARYAERLVAEGSADRGESETWLQARWTHYEDGTLPARHCAHELQREEKGGHNIAKIGFSQSRQFKVACLRIVYMHLTSRVQRIRECCRLLRVLSYSSDAARHADTHALTRLTR